VPALVALDEPVGGQARRTPPLRLRNGKCIASLRMPAVPETRRMAHRSGARPHNGPGRAWRMVICAGAVIAFAMALPRVATACPSCHAAVAARAAIREDPNLWFYAAVSVLPFVLLAILAVRLHRVGRPSLTAQASPTDRHTLPGEKTPR
jgi:hypothetical protein